MPDTQKTYPSTTASAQRENTRLLFARIDAVVVRHLSELRKPGVLSVRPGYKAVGGWLTATPSIVVVVRSKDTEVSPDQKLPSSLEGIPVDVREASPLQLLRADDPTKYQLAAATAHHEVRLPEFPFEREVTTGNPLTSLTAAPDANAELSAKPQIPYKSLSDVPLTPVEDNMTITCHASPDAGWPELKAFLDGTKTSLTVGMYDFTSAHILQEVTDAVENSRGDLKLTLDHPAPNPTLDQTDDVTVQSLENSLGNQQFQSAWALVRSSAKASSWCFPTAYHIKVAVRDSASLWLSSGNFNNSNQPDIDPVNHPSKSADQIASKSDRDWHLVIDHSGLAQTYEKYLQNDFETAAQNAQTGLGVASETLTLAEALGLSAIPDAALMVPSQYFAPKTINKRVRVQPLLTPDVKDGSPQYCTAVLSLIQSAQKSLYLQTQYIHPSDKAQDQGLTDLIDAVIERQQAGVDVRIITSQFQGMNGWLDRLQQAGVDLSSVRIQTGVHNKGIVVDSKVVMVSSQNWSGDGVLRNRDAGMIIFDEDAAQYFEQIFIHDWVNMARQQAAGLKSSTVLPDTKAAVASAFAASTSVQITTPAALSEAHIASQFEAHGTAQVMVFLHPLLSLSSAEGRKQPPPNLARHFVPPRIVSLRRREAALALTSTTLSAVAARETASPNVRMFPRLGVMLGSVTPTGLAALSQEPEVARVTGAPPITIIRPVVMSEAAALENVTWGIQMLRVPELWNAGITGKDVLVAHLDTGVDGGHPALQNAIKAFALFDEMGNLTTPSPAAHDSGQHGTHTAGTIAGRTTNGQSFGVAPEALLLSACVIEGGDVIARVLGGMEWALENQARVLSMSLGLPGWWPSFQPLMRTLRQQGVLPCIAAGNEGVGTSRSPGNYPEVLSVGAVDDNSAVANFSSSDTVQGHQIPDLVSPGVAVFSSVPGGGYMKMSGTSMATPHMAGLAALLLHAQPAATVDEIENAILQSCKRTAGMDPLRAGAGVPDAVIAYTTLTGRPLARSAPVNSAA